MQIAEAPRRSTLRSDTSEFYLRIFDSWSCGMLAEELAGAGDDGPAWQTFGAFLPLPPRGLRSRTKHERWWRWGKRVVRTGPILHDQKVHKGKNSVFERHAK